MHVLTRLWVLEGRRLLALLLLAVFFAGMLCLSSCARAELGPGGVEAGVGVGPLKVKAGN